MDNSEYCDENFGICILIFIFCPEGVITAMCVPGKFMRPPPMTNYYPIFSYGHAVFKMVTNFTS